MDCEGDGMTTERSFESSLKELEQIVQQLEGGDLPLERSLELYEQGVRLYRECQQRLDEAEHKVEILLKGSDGAVKAVPMKQPED
jgi:exodeoxyribonuclease VII small subunit